jgi:hypothetical protein
VDAVLQEEAVDSAYALRGIADLHLGMLCAAIRRWAILGDLWLLQAIRVDDSNCFPSHPDALIVMETR